ncbi:MAG: hypothetical protein A2Y60_06890 [Chloroflexi bacterium RBG_13_54_9]|nr:MAG: hypothetical protein A2Y60_06890 [Chloroflexi bacterium RBG_13_54_9]
MFESVWSFLSLLLEPPWRWVAILALVSAICAATDMIMRSHPRLRSHHVAYTVLFWTLPTLIIVVAFVALPLFSSGSWLTTGAAVSAAVVGIVVFCEYHAIDPQDKIHDASRYVLNLVVYLLAFIFYVTIRQLEMETFVSVLAAWAVSALLAVELFREKGKPGVVALYAAITGLIIGETKWALLYWATGGVMGGIFLLLLFYFVTGVTQHYLAGELRRGTVLEFAGVVVLGFALVYFSRLWMR